MNRGVITSRNEWIAELNQGNISAKELLKDLSTSEKVFVWHPLGFLMCRIARWGQVSLRIHVWPNHNDYQQRPAWLIHDHLFHLKSWVLSGGIENILYDVDDSNSDYSIYGVYYDGNKSILKKTDAKCSKEEYRRDLIVNGDVYEVESGIFHLSNSISNKVSLTVCETKDELDRTPRVLGDINGNLSYTYLRRKASLAEIQKLISGI